LFRTSSNKFEFRAVGSSQNPSRSNVVLNTILAESIQHLATELEKLLKSGKGKDEAIIEVARKTFVKHWDIVYNGNGYSEEWQKEAARRGLPNLRTTPQALKELDNPKTIKLFNDMKVLTVDEIKARKIVFEEDYAKKLLIEAKNLTNYRSNTAHPSLQSLRRGIGHYFGSLERIQEWRSYVEYFKQYYRPSVWWTS